jgi:hypothetical protein
MHVQGVVEAHDGQSWLGYTDLPHLPLTACPPVFGQPTPPAGDAIAPDRGIPEEYSDLLARRYFKDDSSVYGDTGPWRHAVGETWVCAEELPDSVRADERWANVCDALAPAEDEYGPANVRVVVWFED